MRYLLALLSFARLCFLQGAEPAFKVTEHTITTGLKGGYQVVAVDLNHDGRTDLIALASGMTELAWYENPGSREGTWNRHVLATGLPRMINCAAEDLDGDGIPEIVIAWEFANEPSRSIGKVGILRHGGDLYAPWSLTEFDQLTTSHRIRWADLDGNGKRVAVNAVLAGAEAKAPLYEGHPPLVFYRPGEWKRTVLTEANRGVQHGILVTRWLPGDARDSILTASFSGIHLIRWAGGNWQRTEIAKGDGSPCPKCGSSDVAVGTFGKERFLAAIEPWHGNQVAIYTERGGKWGRTVVGDTLTDGHTILASDFDGDGNDEIVVGFRQGAKAVYLYRLEGDKWNREVLDSGIGAASCAAAHLLSGAGTQLACIGSTTLKWYEVVSER